MASARVAVFSCLPCSAVSVICTIPTYDSGLLNLLCTIDFSLQRFSLVSTANHVATKGRWSKVGNLNSKPRAFHGSASCNINMSPSGCKAADLLIAACLRTARYYPTMYIGTYIPSRDVPIMSLVSRDPSLGVGVVPRVTSRSVTSGTNRICALQLAVPCDFANSLEQGLWWASRPRPSLSMNMYYLCTEYSDQKMVNFQLFWARKTGPQRAHRYVISYNILRSPHTAASRTDLP